MLSPYYYIISASYAWTQNILSPKKKIKIYSYQTEGNARILEKNPLILEMKGKIMCELGLRADYYLFYYLCHLNIAVTSVAFPLFSLTRYLTQFQGQLRIFLRFSGIC